jgi:Vault protein inter-alpha-trypsin domain
VISNLICEFKLPDGSTKTIETKIIGKEKAEEKYEDAIAKGKTAVLGSLDPPNTG